MPIYDYDCAACGRRVEVVHGVHSPGPTHCPNCGSGPLRKAISAPAVHFKGSGWAKKERRATVAPGASKASDGSSAGDGDGKAADPSGGEGEHKAPAANGHDAAETTGERNRDERSGSASKPAAAGTATKTD